MPVPDAFLLPEGLRRALHLVITAPPPRPGPLLGRTSARARVVWRSMRPDQAVIFLRSQAACNLRTDVMLEATDGSPSQWTQNAIHRALIVA